MVTLVQIVLALAVLAAPPEQSKEAPSKAIENATADEVSQWVMNYYRDPKPAAVPQLVRRMSELKLLVSERPRANQMFIAQTMRANSDKIAGWMSGWKDLPEKDRRALRQAVWLSQTDEGKQWLAENGFKKLAEEKGDPLLTGEPMVLEPYHVDMLWEWFFATGDKVPVRQIVDKFSMLNADPGEADLPEKPTRGGDPATYRRQMVGAVSVWSASSLAARHDKLLAILREIRTDQKLPNRSAEWLKRVISIAERERAVLSNPMPGKR